MKNTNQSPVVSVTVERYEGSVAARAAGENGPFTVATFAEADAILSRWAHTAPARGGYDKCGVRVVWENGETYTTRYDLTHPNYRANDPIAIHVRTELEFWSGTVRPAHLTAEQYAQCVGHVPAERRASLVAMLRDCVTTEGMPA